MAKYLLLKHYRGAPAAVNDVPMDQWTPEEVDAHVQFMRDFATRLEETGEFVDTQALAPGGTFVRSDGEGRPPVTDGPFAETKDLIAGWYVIDVESWDRAVRTRRRSGAVREQLPALLRPRTRRHHRCAGREARLRPHDPASPSTTTTHTRKDRRHGHRR